MRNANFFFGNTISIILIVFTIFSCGFGRSNPVGIQTENDVWETFSTATWKITEFKRGGVSQQQYYTYYIFYFSSNNQIAAKEGSSNYSGSWHIETSENEDDSPKADIDFSMAFEPNDKLSELAASWQIVEKTESNLVLNKVSDSGKAMDLLVFEKLQN